jgi:hypothetical protein
MFAGALSYLEYSELILNKTHIIYTVIDCGWTLQMQRILTASWSQEQMSNDSWKWTAHILLWLHCLC